MTEILNSSEALRYFQAALQERGFSIQKTVKASTGDGFFHDQIYTDSNEIFHLKYTKNPYTPKPSEKVSQGAKELDEKIKFAIRKFGNGDNTIIGLNENVVLDLLEKSNEGFQVYFVTVLKSGEIKWSNIQEFYMFLMRHDTFVKFARSNYPQAFVPTGWLRKWEHPIIAYPNY